MTVDPKGGIAALAVGRPLPTAVFDYDIAIGSITTGCLRPGQVGEILLIWLRHPRLELCK